MSFIRKKYDYPEGGSGNGIRAAAEKGERFQMNQNRRAGICVNYRSGAAEGQIRCPASKFAKEHPT